MSHRSALDKHRKRYGPARVGGNAYGLSSPTLAETRPADLLLKMAGVTRQSDDWLRVWMTDPQRREDMARLRQRRLLVEIGELEQRIPWHDVTLDDRARHGALTALAALPKTSDRAVGKEGAQLVAETLWLVHADPDLDDPVSALDVGLALILADIVGPDWLKTHLITRPREDPPAAWREHVDACKALVQPEAMAVSSTPQRPMPCFAHGPETALEDELCFTLEPETGADDLPNVPSNVVTATALWTGTRLRLGLRDELETLVADWVPPGPAPVDPPNSKHEALVLAALRFSERSDVLLLGTSRRATASLKRFCARLMGPELQPKDAHQRGAAWWRSSADQATFRGQGAGRVLVSGVKETLWLREAPAVVIVSASATEGIPLDPDWLTGISVRMPLWPTPLVLVAVDASGSRVNVLRDLSRAHHALTLSRTWRSPVARMLDSIVADLGEGPAVALAEAVASSRFVAGAGAHGVDKAHTNAEIDESAPVEHWGSGILEAIGAEAPPTITETLAWRTAQHDASRRMLAQIWRPGRTDGNPEPEVDQSAQGHSR